MQRQILRLLVAAFALLPVLGVGQQPASAHTDTCVTHDIMWAGEFLPLFTPVTTSFTMYYSEGTACAVNALTASGTLTGTCTSMTATGTTDTGHHFTWTVTGSVGVSTGEMLGSFALYADPSSYQNCHMSGSARRFILDGAFALI